MAKRDFISTEEWQPGEIDGLLALAARVKRGEIKDGLARKVLALVFMDPSLRTRASFEAAMFLHGGHAIVLEPGKGSWTLETQIDAVMDGTSVEHIIEAARVLGRYGSALGVRSFPKGDNWQSTRQDEVIRNFAKYSEVPVINMESSRRHPCQGLADALTLREKLKEPKGKRFVLSWGYHPKPLPTAVPASAALAAAHLGMDIVIARPEGYDLDPDDMTAIRDLAKQQGGSVKVESNVDAAMEGAEAVYVKSWGALSQFGKPEAEAAMRAPYKHWKMTQERARMTKNGKGIVMHCLPVRRNVEIDGAVLDGPNSVVVDQAENRMHVQRALLLELIGNRSEWK